MNIVPGVPGKHVIQVAMIVDDVEQACREWTKTTGIGPFMIVPHIQLDEYDHRGKGGSGLDFSVGLAQSGGVQIELIQQHCDSPSAYRDTIAKGQTGFHHLGIYPEDYDAAYAHYVDQGFEVAINGAAGGYRFCYIDTTSSIGCMIELIEANPVHTDDWDGKTDPIRLAFAAEAD